MTPQLSRSVHDLSTRFLNMKANEINTLEQGLQIREDRFDSDTRLHIILDKRSWRLGSDV